MRHAKTLLLIAVLTLGLGGCTAGDLEEQDSTVLLSISDFDGLPVLVSAAACFSVGCPIEQVTVSSIPVNPSGVTSTLQTIEIRSYEVTFQRLDTGTRLPPPLVNAIFGNVAPGATTQFDNLPFLRDAQFAALPLSDLLRVGRDSETGTASIPLRVTLRFFGRTLSGDVVVSQPASFDIDVVP